MVQNAKVVIEVDDPDLLTKIINPEMVEGMGSDIVSDIVALGLAVPQMGKLDCSINFHLTTEFGTEESFIATFQGPWNLYKRLKSITDTFAKEASKASARMVLSFLFQEGLELSDDRFFMMKEILTTLGVGKIHVSAEPTKSGDRL